MLRGISRIKRRAGLVACVAVGASALSAVALAQTSHPASSGTKSVTSDTGAPGWQMALPNGQVVPGNGTPPPGSTSNSAGNGPGTGPLTQAYPAVHHPARAASRHAVKAASSGTKSSNSDTGAPGWQNALPNGQGVPGNGTPPPGSTSNSAGNGKGTGPTTQSYPSP